MKYAVFAACIALAAICPSQISAQTTGGEEPKEDLPKEYLEANEYFDAMEYYFAIEALKDAYSEVSERKQKAEIAFKLGESYRYIGEYKRAESQYERAYRLDYGSICLLKMGDMLKSQGEYEKAIEQYNLYREAVPQDIRGEQGIRSATEAKEWMTNPDSRYQVTNLGRDINSKNADYAAQYAGKAGRETESVIFASFREGSTGKKQDGWTGENFSDLYIINQERRTRGRGRNAEAGPVTWSVPVQIDGEEEIINTEHHEGVIAFDKMQRDMYFTRCRDVRRANMGCAIYVTKRMGVSWQTPELVILAPDSSYSVGHPSLSTDDEMLYFAGRLPGSLGGTDLWLTSYNRRERKWNEPTNLGNIVNTDGNESYPFAHDDGYLYFSSDGLPGMGGLDVFRVELGEDGMPIGAVENLKYPINSEANDYGLVFEPGGTERGFLTSNSSNRADHRGSDDLYSVYLVPLQYTISGTVTSSKNNKPVPQVTVRLDGADGTTSTVNTDGQGYYSFDRSKLSEGVSYKLNFEKSKYLTNTADATTVGVPISAHELIEDEAGDYYIHNILVNKRIDPIEVPIVLPNVFFDLGKWDLRPEAQLALDSVVSILNNNPNITIELRSHTDYRSDDNFNLGLSQKRADTCVSYLVSKGVAKDRLEARGMGETEPFQIPEEYTSYGAETFDAGDHLTERFIRGLSAEDQEVANQINRRTDFKVLRDDYVPSTPVAEEGGTEGETPVGTQPTGPVEGKFHTVVGRETLGRIAREYNLTVMDLRKLNGGMRGVRLEEGMILKITPNGDYAEFDRTHYMVERGDDYGKIAEKLGIEEDALEDLNPDIRENDLKPGMYIQIR